jgi:hypothetical protein
MLLYEMVARKIPYHGMSPGDNESRRGGSYCTTSSASLLHLHDPFYERTRSLTDFQLRPLLLLCLSALFRLCPALRLIGSVLAAGALEAHVSAPPYAPITQSYQSLLGVRSCSSTYFERAAHIPERRNFAGKSGCDCTQQQITESW